MYLITQLHRKSDWNSTFDDETIRSTFEILELSVFIEMIHHFVGLKQIKRHHALNILSQIFILFGVIYYYPLVSLTF